MRSVLVVDDEPSIRTVLRGYLESAGFAVQEADSGSAALDLLRRTTPDVVLLDIMMPGIDGLETLRQLRTFSDVFVILVSARAEEVDKLVGLGVGADDYITKPFSPREVVARVHTMLRRQRAASDGHQTLHFQGLSIDLDARTVMLPAGSVSPSVLEFDLLAALATAPGRVFSRPQLLEQVWGYDFYGDARVVDVHIRNLRNLLGDDASQPRFIATVRGIGYRFVGVPA